MNAIPTPPDYLESITRLKLPPKADQRCQELMDKNNEGLLTESERKELESLVEMSESLSLVRAGAFRLLGRRPA